MQRRDHRTRGVTRLELAFGVAVIGAIVGVGSVAAAALDAGEDRQAAESRGKRILKAAEAWRAENRDVGCPTLTQLLHDEKLDRASHLDDPWGRRFRIACEASSTTVLSSGSDRRLETDDDIHIRGRS